MLNAKNGLAELLSSSGGGNGVSRRQNHEASAEAGLFGDTLKGQMQQVSKQQKPDAQQTYRTGKSTAEQAPKSAEKANDTKIDNPRQDKAEETDNTKGSESGKPDEQIDGVKNLVAAVEEVAEPAANMATTENEFLLSRQTEELPAEDELRLSRQAEELLDEDDEYGNILPFALPQTAAEVLEQPEEDTAEALPHWLRKLANDHGREQVVADDTTDIELKSTEASVDESAQNRASFLKSLQSMTADMEAQGEGGKKPQGAGLNEVFRMAVLNSAKETPPVQNTPLPASASAVAAAAASATPATIAPAATVQNMTVPVSVRQEGWDQAMSERVVWMARQGIKEAQIQLNPRHLGPIEVHVSVNKDQATVNFVAHHTITREALESAMPRLREMLQDSGLDLAQSDVSQQQQQQANDQTVRDFSGSRGDSEQEHDAQAMGDEETMSSETLLDSGTGLGVVDYYA
ncbi:MAG: flagellar hook-length control protein FliK [Thiohalomonadaceae bacterium]